MDQLQSVVKKVQFLHRELRDITTIKQTPWPAEWFVDTGVLFILPSPFSDIILQQRWEQPGLAPIMNFVILEPYICSVDYNPLWPKGEEKIPTVGSVSHRSQGQHFRRVPQHLFSETLSPLHSSHSQPGEFRAFCCSPWFVSHRCRNSHPEPCTKKDLLQDCYSEATDSFGEVFG